jgi:hypothetical protein
VDDAGAFGVRIGGVKAGKIGYSRLPCCARAGVDGQAGRFVYYQYVVVFVDYGYTRRFGGDGRWLRLVNLDPVGCLDQVAGADGGSVDENAA